MIDAQSEPLEEADSAPTSAAAFQHALDAEKDAHLRLAADFHNFRKRTRRDAEQQAAAEKEAVILDLLPILDNLERALASEHVTTPAPMASRRGVILSETAVTHKAPPRAPAPLAARRAP